MPILAKILRIGEPVKSVSNLQEEPRMKSPIRFFDTDYQWWRGHIGDRQKSNRKKSSMREIKSAVLMVTATRSQFECLVASSRSLKGDPIKLRQPSSEFIV